MGGFSNSCKDLVVNMRFRLNDLITIKGCMSVFSNENVLPVPDRCAFNLDGGRYLSELSSSYLIDNKGFRYGYDCLTMEQHAELADVLEV